MLQVPHQVLPFPRAQYSTWDKTGDVTAAQQSHWKFPTNADRFLQSGTKTVLRYAIMLGPNVDNQALSTYQKRLEDQFGKCNLYVDNCQRIPERNFAPRLDPPTQTNIQAKLKDLTGTNRNIDLVFLLLDRPNVAIYRDFKNAADRLVPIQSICMTLKEPRASRDKMLAEINTNIMMKVNLKLGGINHRVDGVSKWLKKTMVVGADLIHPGAGAFPGTPSIAAVVGSVDADGGKCLGSLRLQDINRSDREVCKCRSLTPDTLTPVDHRP